jgi:hypothetical protein
VAERAQPFGGKGAEGAPCAFELIDLAEEGEEFLGDLDGVGIQWDEMSSPAFSPKYTQMSSRCGGEVESAFKVHAGSLAKFLGNFIAPNISNPIASDSAVSLRE